jgi:predicted MFS family arabinose efflux permease
MRERRAVAPFPPGPVPVAFFVFLLCGFASAIASRTLDPLTIVIARDFSVPASSVAMLASAMTLPFALAQPILGPIGDHFGKARILRGALWLSAVSLAMAALAQSYSMLFASRVLTGVAGAGVMPVAMAMITDLYPRGRQIAIARFVASAIVGQILGAVFSGVVESVIGWRGVMWICFAVVLAAAVGANALLPNTPPPQNRGRFSIRAALATYVRIFRNRRAWACYGTVFVVGGLTFGFLPFISPVLESQDNGGAREAGFIIAGMAAGSLIFSLFLPYFLRIVSRPTLIASGGLLGGAGFMGYALGLHWGWQIVLFSCVGLGFFMLHNSVQTEVAEIEPSARTSTYAMHAFSFFLGQSAGPLVWSAAIAALGAPAALVALGMVVLVAGLVAGFVFSRLPRIVSGRL